MDRRSFTILSMGFTGHCMEKMFQEKIVGAYFAPTFRKNGQVYEYHLPELESKIFRDKIDGRIIRPSLDSSGYVIGCKGLHIIMKDLIQNNQQRMASKEIAELTSKDHKNVMRDIKSLIDQSAISWLNFELSSYKNNRCFRCSNILTKWQSS